jgi:hypothetical protein
VPACQSAQANKSSIGCEYYAQEPDPQGSGACYAAFIVNTWNAPITISVDLAGTPLNVSNFARMPSGSGKALTLTPLPSGGLPAGQVAVLFLSDAPTTGGNLFPCPASLLGGATPPHVGANVTGTGIGAAYHITTSAPVAAYDIYPWGGGASAVTSATLLFPTSAWDTNYIAASIWPWEGIFPQNQLQITAASDATTITINPTAAIVGGMGVPGTPQGVPQSYVINKGEILEFEQNDELWGSAIQSDKPIGVWAAHSGLFLPSAKCCADAMHQQIPPIRLLGSEYVAVRYRQRSLSIAEETPPWLVMAVVDGTTLTYEPSPPAGAPMSLNAGQGVRFNASGPFVVRSQDALHPIYVASYMTGGAMIKDTAPNAPEGAPGDPEFVNVVPTAEYLKKYIFFTDPTYPETDLVFVRKKGQDAMFHDVTLDCAGAITGWLPADSSGNYEYTRVDLVRGNFVPQGNCDNGRHEVQSDAPFALTVWGWGTAATGGNVFDPTSFYSQWVSYAYPAGQGVAQINTVVVPVTK